MAIRTDIAYELYKGLNSHTKDISLDKEEFLHNISVTNIEVKNENGAKMIGRQVGGYITIESPQVVSRDLGIQKYTAKIISNKLSQIIEKNFSNKNFKTLVVGLGNKNMTADALGDLVCDNIIVTRHIYELLSSNHDKTLQCVSAVAPNVLGETGIETFDVIKGVVERIKPDLVIVVDSLASQKTSRISTSFQISDSGIVPGSGINNHRMRLDKSSLGVPVISIGVPLVVYAQTICNDVISKLIFSTEEQFDESVTEDAINSTITEVLGDLVVTPKDIDVIVEDCSFILSIAINLAIHPRLSVDDVISYMH